MSKILITLILIVQLLLISCNSDKSRTFKQINSIEKLIAEKRLDDALLKLNDLISANKKSGYIYNIRARVYLQLNQYKSAANDYQKAINRNEYDSEALSGLALIYYRGKNFDKALSFLEKALKYEPEKHILNYNMFQLLYQLNKKKQATPYLEKALKYSAHEIKARQNYQKLYTNLY